MDTTIKADRGLSEVAECVLRLMSWTLQFVYVNVLVERIAPSPRGSRPVLLVCPFILEKRSKSLTLLLSSCFIHYFRLFLSFTAICDSFRKQHFHV